MAEQSATILVIDDSEVVLDVMRTTLEGEGYTVITESSPFRGFMTIRDAKPDLVLLDLSMPGLSGDALIEVVHDSGATRDVTIVLHSEKDEPTLQKAVAASGAAGYIKKTSDRERLLNTIARWLEPINAQSAQ